MQNMNKNFYKDLFISSTMNIQDNPYPCVLHALILHSGINCILFDLFNGCDVSHLIQCDKLLQYTICRDLRVWVTSGEGLIKVLQRNVVFPNVREIHVTDHLTAHSKLILHETTFPNLRSVCFFDLKCVESLDITCGQLENLEILDGTSFLILASLKLPPSLRRLVVKSPMEEMDYEHLLDNLSRNLEYIDICMPDDAISHYKCNVLDLSKHCKLREVYVVSSSYSPAQVILGSLELIEVLDLERVDLRIEIDAKESQMRWLNLHEVSISSCVCSTQFPQINLFRVFNSQLGSIGSRIFQDAIERDQDSLEMFTPSWNSPLQNIILKINSLEYLYCNLCEHIEILGTGDFLSINNDTNIFVYNLPNLTQIKIGKRAPDWYLQPNSPSLCHFEFRWPPDFVTIQLLQTSPIKLLEITWFPSDISNESITSLLSSSSSQLEELKLYIVGKTPFHLSGLQTVKHLKLSLQTQSIHHVELKQMLELETLEFLTITPILHLFLEEIPNLYAIGLPSSFEFDQELFLTERPKNTLHGKFARERTSSPLYDSTIWIQKCVNNCDKSY